MPFFSKDTQATIFRSKLRLFNQFQCKILDFFIFISFLEFPLFGSCVLFLFHLVPPDWATKGKGGGEEEEAHPAHSRHRLTERKKQLKKAKIAEAEEADPLHKHKVSLGNHHHGREDGQSVLPSDTSASKGACAGAGEGPLAGEAVAAP